MASTPSANVFSTLSASGDISRATSTPSVFFARASLPSCRLKVNTPAKPAPSDRKSTRLNSSHLVNSYAVFCLKKTPTKPKKKPTPPPHQAEDKTKEKKRAE